MILPKTSVMDASTDADIIQGTSANDELAFIVCLLGSKGALLAT